jgi:acyl-coenzyme A thioesterase PaaI-like protein
MESSSLIIQDYMSGNVCFGCGSTHPDGLQIKSVWHGDECICIWNSQEKYQGWKNILNGGILATLIDCHAMGTALSHAYHLEKRAYNSLPLYRYATGTITVKYLQPTPNDTPVELIAHIIEVKGKKTVVKCAVWSAGVQTAEAEIIALRVYDSSNTELGNPFAE